MSKTIDKIRDYVYRDALTSDTALALHWAAVAADDEAAQLYLQDLLFGLAWRPFDQTRLEASLWCASQELIAQTKRCRARRITADICRVSAGIVASQVGKSTDERWNLTVQEGVPGGSAYSPYGPGKSDRLSCTIIKIGDLCSYRSQAIRTRAPTQRWSPITLKSENWIGDRFVGAWLLTGEEEAVDADALTL